MLDMTQKIFNSYKLRIKMNLKFKRFYWGTRSLHNKSSIGGIDYSGFACNYDTTSYIAILPVCSI